MVVGILAVLSISVADTYFVAQLGTNELAALSFTFPVVFCMASIGIGLGAGASSVVSRAVGSGDERRVRRLATDSLILALLIVGGLATLGLLTIEPLFRLLGARPAQMEHIVAYMRIWYPGMVLLVVPMVANNILRATGDAIFPSAIMVVAAVVNITLDPILIFGLGPIPALGVEGAAWATLAARFAPLAGSLYLLHRRDRLLEFTIPPMAELRECWRSIAAVALPAAMGNVINPLGYGILTAIVASFGADAVAGFGVATRIEALALVPIFALSAGIAPIVGQNWGAGQHARIRLALTQCFAAGALWAVLLAASLWLFGAEIVRLFSAEVEIVQVATGYLDIVPLSLAGYGAMVCAAAAFNAIGRAGRGLVLHVVRTLVLTAPLAWLGAELIGPPGVALAVAAANVASAGLAVWLSRRTLVRS
ncbi:MAG: MATE family efflux transporter [Rhodospirillaceae bacterium]|nr:MATE family efflux transporter [Rhodospirillaceae bacterium]MBT6116713.1 MATE family efflux transporter [Rhodospirillaceae bacterium]